MTTRRIFIAIKIANTEQISKIFREVKCYLKDECIKWVDKNTLHITLSFLGDTDIMKITDIKNGLILAAENISPFTIQLKSLGAFSTIESPRVLWIGIDDALKIYELRNRIIEQLKDIINEKDARFLPHITIGRIKFGVKNPKKVSNILNGYEYSKFDKFYIQEFVLMESKLTKYGPIYKVIEKFDLK